MAETTEKVKETDVTPEMEERTIAFEKIVADDKFNARKDFGTEKDQTELVNSIKRNGLLSPLIVKELEGGKYFLIAGFRRHRALKELKVTKVTVRVFQGDEKDAAFINLVENEARRNLKTWELAEASQKLCKAHDLTGADIARQLGRSASYINNLINAISKLHPEIIKAWKSGHTLATTDRLNKLVPLSHPEQWKLWETWVGPAPEEDGEDDGKGDSSPRTTETKYKRASVEKLQEAKAAIKRAADMSEKWREGALVAINFALGADGASICGVIVRGKKGKKGKKDKE